MSSHDQTIIDELNRSLDRIEKTAPMIGSYSRIEPRIIAQHQGGKNFRFIVFHIESQVWFDNSNIDASLLEFQQRRFLRPNDVAFDVGCNTGFVTTWLALELTQGHVHSFDPYPWNAVATRANAAINHCTNVTVHDVGLGLRDDSFLVPANSSRTYNTERYENVPVIEIKVRNPEHYAHFRPNFMKIDIEGAEHELSMTGLPNYRALREGTSRFTHP